ncbi:MAG: transglutaminase domain-containing protein [Rhodobacteraceae bacterium]|uniref:transglutaminase family protein n=1 Tax=Cypionkella sp. TaxID=2811411 RepID=UPI0013237672|nr:transglutaminase family protein [Cypionkella sp.]KAF0172084.1 MAG: transglutaminase domain-containing protein [Paracoccaceae bacterium]MDO8326222.1 transglutaminase family protein [Cypionkella sp.]
MLLNVDHTTLYRYDRPVRGVVQSHRLTPSRFDGQQVLDWAVTVSGGSMGGGFRDGAGDWVQGWTVAGPVTEIEVRVRGQVQTTDTAGILRGHKELVPPEAYLRASAATEPDEALRALAQILINAESPLAGSHALAEAISEAIAYKPGSTQAQTTAAQALAQGEGVCQDHAHAMIAAARAADVPARYVSGYLQSGADGGDHEAAHAWAELYLQGFGWIGFDPANRCCPDARYIRLGSGLDAQDAAPIRGISRGQGTEILSVAVAVQTQEQ